MGVGSGVGVIGQKVGVVVFVVVWMVRLKEFVRPEVLPGVW